MLLANFVIAIKQQKAL